MTLPWREDEGRRRRSPRPGPDGTQGRPQGPTEPLTPMGRIEPYGRRGSALRDGRPAPWQQKVILGCALGAGVVAAASVLLALFG
ncbi:hypothetical protein [Streptomyces sp. NPDC020742]|uniref:hypothetical protein n=1 Tax=unclassified Streptomyces TaxID=2593676 RepID=UPI0033E3E9BA